MGFFCLDFFDSFDNVSFDLDVVIIVAASFAAVLPPGAVAGILI